MNAEQYEQHKARMRARYWAMTDEERKRHNEACVIRKRNNPTSKETRNAWRRKRRAEDASFRIAEDTSARLQVALKRNRSSEWVKGITGLSTADLRYHIEIQFDPYMSWDNFGKQWQIDHIQPRRDFDHTSPEQFKDCWDFRNLRPLTRTSNATGRPRHYNAIDK